jgi:hypothetical protein
MHPLQEALAVSVHDADDDLARPSVGADRELLAAQLVPAIPG